MYTIDFETEAIAPYPDYPPRPVGVSLKYNSLPSAYFSWGHPCDNNCTFQEVKGILKTIWESKERMLFQNSKFDLEVARKAFHLDYPTTDRVEDTMFLIFLHDPLAPSFSLKPSAERILGLPPTEQEAVRDWLVAQGIVPSNSKHWGAHISKAPGKLVGQYAAGDTDRTYELYQHLLPIIQRQGMEPAYRREVELVRILADNEREGIRCDLFKLDSDIKKYQTEFERASKEIKTMLFQENDEFNLDSGVQLATAIPATGLCIPLDEWPLTPTGRYSTSKETLVSAIRSDRLSSLLNYRSTLKTCLTTFMRPWLEKARNCPGYRLHPSWNQVKGVDYGTKTGRLSSSDPNFQNIPTEFETPPPDGYLPYPLIRSYVLPDEGEVFVSADFHSQEIRMLGHFAEGAIKEIYDADPSADVHAVAANIISDQTGLAINRKHTKITAFSILYGAGVHTMANRLGVSDQESYQIKKAYLDTLVGVKEFMRDVEDRAYSRQPVRSWGGRLLYAPTPVVLANGKVMSKDYVLLNYLIQGSAADQTKQAMIEYDRTRKQGRLLASVHDEICISVNPKHLASEVAILKAAMEAGKFDIPMRATVKVGPNWASLESLV
jgi:DNA polymerase-1